MENDLKKLISLLGEYSTESLPCFEKIKTGLAGIENEPLETALRLTTKSIESYEFDQALDHVAKIIEIIDTLNTAKDTP